jgi:serine protease Do
VTSGVLSAIDRAIKVRAPDGVVREYTGLLQTDAAINPGNSGGALLVITGRLIGINNAMAMGAENIGFAIPMDTVREEFDRELIQSSSFVGAIDGPWLGLEVADRDGNVVVAEVVPGGPADVAGLQAGDILARVGQQDVRSSVDYLRYFSSLHAQRVVPLALQRAGKAREVEAQPIPRYAGALLLGLGAELEEVSRDADPELVKKTTLAFYRGSNLRRVSLFPASLRVTNVMPASPAEAFGLKTGDVLLSVVVDNGRYGARWAQLTSVRDFASLVDAKRGQSLQLAFLRGDKDYEGTIDVRGSSRR